MHIRKDTVHKFTAVIPLNPRILLGEQFLNQHPLHRFLKISSRPQSHDRANRRETMLNQDQHAKQNGILAQLIHIRRDRAIYQPLRRDGKTQRKKSRSNRDQTYEHDPKMHTL